MKKVLVVFGMLFGLVAVSHAGIPVEAYYQGQPPLSNTSIVISTFTPLGANNVQSTINVSKAPGTFNNGGASISCRNCFTRFLIQESTNVVTTILDGPTTSYVISGVALGASGDNTISMPEDHLGPVCFTAGLTTTIIMTPNANAGSIESTAPLSVTAEGYTQCGGTNNAGVMQ
jgi:hypothetical protein